MHMKAKMFASLTKGGHLQVFELVDWPEIVVTRKQETRKHNWVQTIQVELRTFEGIEAAIEYAKELRNAGTPALPKQF